LYQVHYADPSTPIAETIEALEALVAAGKIRRYGISHLAVEKAERFFDAGEIFSVLMEFSPAVRQARRQLLPACRDHDVAAIAFSVTGRGLLTGALPKRPAFGPGDIRNIDPLFQRESYQAGLRTAEKLAQIGRGYDKTAAQAAIAWVLSHPGIVCALTGPSKLEHLEENLGGSGWALSPQDLDSLEKFFRQQDQWLQDEQKASLASILRSPLRADPFEAYKDLVYVFETSLSLGLAEEGQITPAYLQLFDLRNKLEGSRPKLKEIHESLQKDIPLEG
jgi:aryl-alcohol dehydrogenase-like predicted oxidoreductase